LDRYIWLDALTPKQARLSAALASKLTDRGYKVFITARDYDYTVAVLRRFAPPSARLEVVGGYGGATRQGKLKAELERSYGLVDTVSSLNPCMLIAYPSPSATRVAFGLGIPVTILFDSPHAYHVNRLAATLADHIVYSDFIPRDQVVKYVLSSFTKLYSYHGVDELEYVMDYVIRSSSKPSNELNLEPLSYVVVRPAEYKAAYYESLKPPAIEVLVKWLASKGVKVVVFPRYEEQQIVFKSINNVVIPSNAVDTLPLIDEAIAVVTGGATLAREAALLGTPGLTLYPGEIAVSKALEDLGLPHFHLRSIEEAKQLLESIIRDPDLHRVKGVKLKTIVAGLEPPSLRILEITREVC
jgi:predicted glycosyltransferase